MPTRLANWDCQRYERAAHLLGRLSASRELAPLAGLRDVDWSLTMVETHGRPATAAQIGDLEVVAPAEH